MYIVELLHRGSEGQTSHYGYVEKSEVYHNQQGYEVTKDSTLLSAFKFHSQREAERIGSHLIENNEQNYMLNIIEEEK
jgi:hypothetical protein